MNSYRHAKL